MTVMVVRSKCSSHNMLPAGLHLAVWQECQMCVKQLTDASGWLASMHISWSDVMPSMI